MNDFTFGGWRNPNWKMWGKMLTLTTGTTSNIIDFGWSDAPTPKPKGSNQAWLDNRIDEIRVKL